MTGRPIFKRPAAWWRRPWVWIAMGALALAFGNSGFRRLVTRWWELRRLRGELRSLEADRARLEEGLSIAERAGPELERSARKDLGYLRPGEVEYRFPPPAASSNNGGPRTPARAKARSPDDRP